jgi:hypothetical protein
MGQKPMWQHVGAMSALPMEAKVSTRPTRFTAVEPGKGDSNARVEPKGNAIVITKQASGTEKIHPLMAAFNTVAWMSANPSSTVATGEAAPQRRPIVFPQPSPPGKAGYSMIIR